MPGITGGVTSLLAGKKISPPWQPQSKVTARADMVCRLAVIPSDTTRLWRKWAWHHRILKASLNLSLSLMMLEPEKLADGKKPHQLLLGCICRCANVFHILSLNRTADIVIPNCRVQICLQKAEGKRRSRFQVNSPLRV